MARQPGPKAKWSITERANDIENNKTLPPSPEYLAQVAAKDRVSMWSKEWRNRKK